jgi:subtilisin family serine protease
MKRFSILVVFVLAVQSLYAGNGPDWKAADPIAGEYIVVLADQKSRAVDAAAGALAKAHGGSVIVTLKNGVKAFGMRMNEQQAEALARNPLVDHVEENGKVFLSQTSYSLQEFPDDTWWHLDRIDNRGPLYSYHAYAYTTTGAGVNAYVLDTGVLGTHEQFGGRVQTGQTYADQYPANNPCGGFGDFYGPGHGTAVASVIGGSTNGVAKGVTIIPVKVWTCDPNNSGAMASNTLWWCWGLDWILGNQQAFPNSTRRAVVNISGGLIVAANQNICVGTTTCLAAFENNVRNLVMNNIVVVAAANNQNNGNCATSPARMGYGNPAFDFHVITVGGSTETDTRWVRLANEMIPNCNPGTGCNDTGSNFGQCVDIYAPAQHFRHLAHIASNTAYRDPVNHIDQISGTSFASPVVAGMAARLLQGHPTWTAQQVWTYIRDQANHPGCFDNTVVPCNDRLAYLSPYD